MRYDFSDDPYYQTAKQEKADMEERERLEDEARQEAEERVSECDCCQQMKAGCVDLVYLGMDTHACPECRGDSSENY